MDGVNITNPGFGYLETEINELDIAEFNVKRGAISAEFGRAAGIVTNAVSRSGTNTFSGSARIQYQPESFMSNPDDPAFGVQPTDNLNPAIGLGGPIVKDKVFFYASAQYQKVTRGDRVNKFGTALPDLESSTQEYYGKVTSTPTPKHLLAASYRYRPTDTRGRRRRVRHRARASPRPTRPGPTIATASWSWFATSRTTLDLKFLYMKDDNSCASPSRASATCPPGTTTTSPRWGSTPTRTRRTSTSAATSTRTARTTGATRSRRSVSQYFDLGKTGHQLKAGVGYTFGEEDLNRLTNGWGQISRITATVPYYRARYYFEQPSQIGQGRTWSIFAQDTMTVGSRLTLNLGILIEPGRLRAGPARTAAAARRRSNTLSGSPGGAAVFESDGDRCTFVKFGFGDQIQPRLGVNFNVRPGKGDKVYANWGRYYNMDQQSSGRSLAPRRIYQSEARFTVATGALISDLPRAATTGKLIDPDLKPTYNDEWLAGYATPIGRPAGALDLFYMYRNTQQLHRGRALGLPVHRPLRRRQPALHDCSRPVAGQEAKRKYQAATVEINRRFADRWSANVSYTWSQFEGNIDYDYGGGTAVFNTSSIWQDGPGTFVGDPYRYGPLREDRPHVFKVFANVRAGRQPDAGRLPPRPERDALAGPRAGLAGRLGAVLPRAGGLAPQPDLDQLRLPRLLPLQALGASRAWSSRRAPSTCSTARRSCRPTRSSTPTPRALPVAPYITEGTILNSFFGTPNGFAAGRRVVLAARFDF